MGLRRSFSADPPWATIPSQLCAAPSCPQTARLGFPFHSAFPGQSQGTGLRLSSFPTAGESKVLRVLDEGTGAYPVLCLSRSQLGSSQNMEGGTKLCASYKAPKVSSSQDLVASGAAGQPRSMGPHSDMFSCPVPCKVQGVGSRGYPCGQGVDYQGVWGPPSRSSALSRNSALHNLAEAAVGRVCR